MERSGTHRFRYFLLRLEATYINTELDISLIQITAPIGKEIFEYVPGSEKGCAH